MTLLKSTISFLIVSLVSLSVFAGGEHKEYYQKAFQEQHQMLKGEKPVDFTRAVFVTENSYYNGQLNYNDFKKEIKETTVKLQGFIDKWEMNSFKTAVNWAVFSYMTEKIPENNSIPYSYDFNDYFGEQHFSNMFVTKLMKEKNGNCHSMPYLYKILCDEMGAEAHLAITPNHVYIKHQSEKDQWVNVELTNASFPKDKWIIKDFILPDKAVENKLYMQALSDKETIAITLFDLANGYENQFGVDSFYLSVVDTALSYYPHSIALLMSKANYYTALVKSEQEKKVPNSEYLKELQKSESIIDRLIKELGHEGMSKKMYGKMVRMMHKQMKKQKEKQDKKLAKKNKKKNKNQT